MRPTPLRGPKIGGILKVIFGPIAFAIEQCGAADGQAVMRPIDRDGDNSGCRTNVNGLSKSPRTTITASTKPGIGTSSALVHASVKIG